jgi:hypothetical protein
MRINVTWNEMRKRLEAKGLDPHEASLDRISVSCPECKKAGRSGHMTVQRVEGYEGVEFVPDCFHEPDAIRVDLGFSESEVISPSRAGRGRRVRRE